MDEIGQDANPHDLQEVADFLGRETWQGVEDRRAIGLLAEHSIHKQTVPVLADRTGLTIGVSHFPPGTSKWNKIEHRLLCHITENWRGRPLVDHETIVQLIGSVRTSTGLSVKSKLDVRTYQTGITVSDAQMDQPNIVAAAFHGEWNYTIKPTRPQCR